MVNVSLLGHREEEVVNVSLLGHRGEEVASISLLGHRRGKKRWPVSLC